MEDCATMDERTRETVEAYISTLSDLVVNSKPHINALTMLAEEYIKQAAAIVTAIEKHLQKVRSEIKLPVLYVIDSIVKNVKGEYIALFTKRIVETFADVFAKVDEDTRANMYKLRHTWVGVFDENTLYLLDLRIHAIDPAWPVTAKRNSSLTTGSIHLNPKFFNQQNKIVEQEKIDNKLMRDQLLQKQRHLLQLQKQKIELELRQTEATIEQQNKQLNEKASLLKDDLYPTASATLFKSMNANGPRIAPASTISAGSATIPVSRDPRLKTTTVTETAKAATVEPGKAASKPVTALSTVTSNKDNSNNMANKTSSITNKDGSLHRSSQKKEPRLSSNLSSSNSPKATSQSPVSNIKPSPPPSKQPSSSPSSKSRSADKRRSSKKDLDKEGPSKSEKVARLASDDYDPAAPVADMLLEPNRSASSSCSPSPPSKARKIKSKSSRKRSPSPAPYRIPKRVVDKTSSSGVTEEEQSGSLIVSPPHPPAFKDIRPNAKQRNYIRRNKDGSASPDTSPASDSIVASNKDEDLRAKLMITPPLTDKISIFTEEDLDLRVIPPVSSKRSTNSDSVELLAAKKTKEEKFDELFGNEDVDLRTLTHPNAGRPPTPPPPVISGEDGKDGWAKIKLQVRNERDKISTSGDEKQDRDRNRNRLGRPRLYSKLPDDPEERRRTLQTSDDVDVKSGRRSRESYDRNSEMNTESLERIMKDAAEKLEQGDITKTEYNALIQGVLHMSEDRKLRAAQRKEKEIWDKGYEKNHDRSHSFGPGEQDKFRPRNPTGPRWQGHPWQQPHFGHPDFSQNPYNPGYRPMGPHPWQNPPRHFNPMRPAEFQFHPFQTAMGPNRMPGMMGPMGHNGPMLPNHIMNGPLHDMGMMSGMTNMNGPIGAMNKFGIHGPRNQTPALPQVKFGGENVDSTSNNSSTNSRDFDNLDIPMPDPTTLEQASQDPTKSITIDGFPREIRYYGDTGVVFWKWDDPREIGFQNGVRRALINEKESMLLIFNGPYQEFTFDSQVHRIKLGTPTKELCVDDKWYECCFGGMPTIVELNGKKVSIKLEGPPPQVRIGETKRTDLVLGKINLIINAGNGTPVFLDAKPQIIEIEGQSHTLEFIDAFRTVLINGKPFKFEFGGLPKPIVIGGKKHYLRFSVLPQGYTAGKVKTAGMRGEPPSDSPPSSPTLSQKANTEAAPATHFNSPFEHDSSSQEAKSDMQLDMLSSALPSAMAPASGLSYEAENPPAPTPSLPSQLDVNKLFQKLMDNGVFALFSSKKEETVKPEEKEEEPEKKEPEIVVSFSVPESIKTKHPKLHKKLYEGIQCSSCGVRFAPDDMATRYSHHLDWHFRQNRREKDSARKAHSRAWYYDVSDWIQFEEIEDLEERAQSWFETEKQSAEDGSAQGNNGSEETRMSVPAGPELDPRCEVCHDTFELFFDEDKEEWHLTPAVRFEEKNFHPLCLEDHKRALERAALETSVEESFDESKEDVEMKDVEMNEETPIEVTVEEEEEEEERDEEVTEEVKEELKEEVKDEESKEDEEKKEETEEDPDIIMEKVVDPSENKCVQAEIVLDDDDDEEQTAEGGDNAEETKADTQEKTEEEIDFSKVKIKQEPVDPDDMEFTESISKNEPVDEIIAPDERLIQDAAVLDTTQVVLKSSIDGNVEIESIPVTMPSVSSKIKININLPQRRSASPKDKNENKEQEKSTAEVDPKPEPEYVPANIKPALQGRKLSVIPPIEKDKDMSALCSIM